MFKQQFCIHVQTSSTKQKEHSYSEKAHKIFANNFVLSCNFFYFSATHLMLNNAEKKLAIKTDTGTISKHVAYKKCQEYSKHNGQRKEPLVDFLLYLPLY